MFKKKTKYDFIISKTPFRISFLGGGTDFPDYYNKFGSTIISTAINKYCYVQIKKLYPFFDYNFRIVYSNIELKKKINLIEHPTVKSCLNYFDLKSQIEILHQGELPSMTGVGSSSAFVVGLLNTLNEFIGRKKLTKKKLAELAVFIERKKNKEKGGVQDQFASSFGGFNILNFQNNNSSVIEIENKYIKKKIKNSIVIVGTKAKRFSSNIIDTYKKDLSILHDMRYLANEGKRMIINNNFKINYFASLIKESWGLKKRLSNKISNNEIDEIIKYGLTKGAYSGKLVGAGGSGCLIFFVEDKKNFQKQFFVKKNNFFEIPFDFDHGGSRLIYKS